MRTSDEKYQYLQHMADYIWSVRVGLVCCMIYIFAIYAANWSIGHLGYCSGQGPCTIPVWLGVMAPSGVLFAGLALTMRDIVQDRLGRVFVVGAVLVGAVLSAWLSTGLAVASGTAFLVSELADFAVYTPLHSRSWLRAIALSNTVGLVIDSVLFLWLAFGSLDFIEGQIIGKLWATVVAVVVLYFVRRKI